MFKIGERTIGAGEIPLVIAEIGINHGGVLDVAIEMADAAAGSGVEVVKHQTHVVEDEMSYHAKSIQPGNSDLAIYDIMAGCALSEVDEIALMQHVESRGMLFMSTPFSRAAFYRLERMGVKVYKVGSGECNNYPLLKLIAATGKPTILSTGMNDLQSVQKAVEIFFQSESPLALLHTTNLYPTEDALVRLGGMDQLMKAYPQLPVGLSDHTLDNLACIVAMAKGAAIVERHFTDHKGRQGPDIICSMDAAECQALIVAAERVTSMLGGNKEKLKEEEVTTRFAYASVVADKAIQQGERLSEENLWVRRPGTGEFLAPDYDKLLGKVAAVDIAQGEQIKASDIA